MIPLIIIVVTCIVSIIVFSSKQLSDKYSFSPYMVVHHKQWYRVLTHGFLHADWIHLIVNMFVFYSFGQAVMYYFKELEFIGTIKSAEFHFVFLYIAAIAVSILTTLKKHKDNYSYHAVGASGAVSAMVFTSIFFNPWSNIAIYGIINVPGIFLGIGYLIYSQFMSKKGIDNINHDAHFLGAVFGFIYPLFINPKLINHFISQLINL